MGSVVEYFGHPDVTCLGSGYRDQWTYRSLGSSYIEVASEIEIVVYVRIDSYICSFTFCVYIFQQLSHFVDSIFLFIEKIGEEYRGLMCG